MYKIKIGTLQLKYYLVCAVVVLTAVYTGNLNNDIIGNFAFLQQYYLRLPFRH